LHVDDYAYTKLTLCFHFQIKSLEETNNQAEKDLAKMAGSLKDLENAAKASKETEQRLLSDLQHAEQRAQTLAQEKDTLSQDVKRLQSTPAAAPAAAPKGIPPIDIQVHPHCLCAFGQHRYASVSTSMSSFAFLL
jgi:predicted  nucleic acid-binding Zn-ribbon protein